MCLPTKCSILFNVCIWLAIRTRTVSFGSGSGLLFFCKKKGRFRKIKAIRIRYIQIVGKIQQHLFYSKAFVFYYHQDHGTNIYEMVAQITMRTCWVIKAFFLHRQQCPIWNVSQPGSFHTSAMGSDPPSIINTKNDTEMVGSGLTQIVFTDPQLRA